MAAKPAIFDLLELESLELELSALVPNENELAVGFTAGIVSELLENFELVSLLIAADGGLSLSPKLVLTGLFTGVDDAPKEKPELGLVSVALILNAVDSFFSGVATAGF